MNKQSVIDGLSKISAVMTENKEYLIKLDQQNGDGDLGVSMSEGFAAAAAFLLLAKISKVLLQSKQMRINLLQLLKKRRKEFLNITSMFRLNMLENVKIGVILIFMKMFFIMVRK